MPFVYETFSENAITFDFPLELICLAGAVGFISADKNDCI